MEAVYMTQQAKEYQPVKGGCGRTAESQEFSAVVVAVCLILAGILLAATYAVQ
jgi:hypothetical protein